MRTLIFAGKQIMRTRDVRKQELVSRKAIELLVKEGFEGFSMNGLARACRISVATLYIYYRDKDDLIVRIALEEGARMTQAVMKDFDPDSSFEEGLRVQWKNRSAYYLANPLTNAFFEQLHSSTYHDKASLPITEKFKETMGRFMRNAIGRGEIDSLPLEVFWSVAYGPLHQLLRFHQEGKSIGGRPFTLTQKTLWQAFGLVVKSLKK
jgi:TetR/AcrR family transcriptional regulator, multidrug resistance operon repressor